MYALNAAWLLMCTKADKGSLMNSSRAKPCIKHAAGLAYHQAGFQIVDDQAVNGGIEEFSMPPFFFF